MKKKLIILFVILLSLINFAEEEITLVSDPYPPYVLDEPNNKGYVTDIALRAFKLTGYNPVYKNVPFKRAVVQVKNGKYDAVLAISIGGREEFVYPETPLGAFNNKFFKRKNDNWMWTGNVNDLENKVLGFIIGYSLGPDEFKNYIEENKNTSKIQLVAGNNTTRRNLKKLIANRIDLLINDEMVVRYEAKKMGISDKISEAGMFDLEEDEIEYVSLGFHESNPKAQEYTEAFDKGIKMMRENGDLKDILDKYGLKEF